MGAQIERKRISHLSLNALKFSSADKFLCIFRNLTDINLNKSKNP